MPAPHMKPTDKNIPLAAEDMGEATVSSDSVETLGSKRNFGRFSLDSGAEWAGEGMPPQGIEGE